MKKSVPRLLLLAAGAAMACLILDSHAAAQAASNAVDLCLRTVIPSLFPMFVLSGLLVDGLAGTKSRALSLLEGFLRLPKGGGSLFLLGMVGGFPVGAQCIVQAVDAGSLAREDGQRMLGYCNNCSPAFLFGILGSVLTGGYGPWMVFLVQLESAMMVALLWPSQPGSKTHIAPKQTSLPKAVLRGIRSMVSVCAWVMLAGVMTGFLDRWLFPVLPQPVPGMLTGLMELTTGVLGLAAISREGARFILCCVFVCFGGASVLLQIQSIAGEQGLSMGLCVRQKAVQAILGGLVAGLCVVFGRGFLVIPLMMLPLAKKAVEFSGKTVYNSSHKGGFDHAVPKKD